MKRLAISALLAACHASEATQPTVTPLPSQTVAAPASSAGCAEDRDCTVSSVQACCSPCGSPPFAEMKRDADALKARCAITECAKPASPQLCKPTEDPSTYHAECQQSKCVAVRNARVTPDEGACNKDSDCVVTAFAGCCAYCLEAPHALSRKELEKRNQVCAVVDCDMSRAPKGGCPRVESPNAYQAVCRTGRCEAVKK